MKILKRGRVVNTPLQGICKICETVVECAFEEILIDDRGQWVVGCPVCEKAIQVSYTQIYEEP